MLAAAPVQAQEAQLRIEAFGNLPVISDAAISRDGAYVALAQARDGQSVVNVVSIAEGRSIFAGSIHEAAQLRGVGWADDTHVSFVMSQTFHPGEVLPRNMRFVGAPRRVDYYRTGVIDVASRDVRILTVNEEEPWQDQSSLLIAPIEGDPGFGRMVDRAPGAQAYRPGPYRVSLDRALSRFVSVRGVDEDTIAIMVDRQGAAALRIDSEADTNRWSVHVYDGEMPRLLLEDVSDTGLPITVEGFLPDGRIVALDDSEDGERFRLYAYDRTTGERSLLFERDGFEIGAAIADPWTREIVGVSWTEIEAQQRFFEPRLQSAYDAALAAFGTSSVWFTSWSADYARILVWAENGLDGGGYYIFTPADNGIRVISMAYPEVARSAASVGAKQSISYRARDGVRVPAYLTLPATDEPRNLPLVILVHGGPHARDTMDFDWWASFLASRGYAVLQPNFRGSSGYGASWENAGHRQWGGLMQTDVEDGVGVLVRSGIADESRVCIVGASYGGYAALAGATLTPDRYTCAVSIAGVSDLNEFLRQRESASGGDDTITSDVWRRSIGDRAEDRERIRGVSPANLADRVRIPILLMHGTDDTVVPILQSRRMYDRLRDAGKSVTYVELRGDDHWLSDASTRLQMLRELETFLAQHIGAAAD